MEYPGGKWGATNEIHVLDISEKRWLFFSEVNAGGLTSGCPDSEWWCYGRWKHSAVADSQGRMWVLGSGAWVHPTYPHPGPDFMYLDTKALVLLKMFFVFYFGPY